jgi:hypothetical protein
MIINKAFTKCYLTGVMISMLYHEITAILEHDHSSIKYHYITESVNHVYVNIYEETAPRE